MGKLERIGFYIGKRYIYKGIRFEYQGQYSGAVICKLLPREGAIVTNYRVYIPDICFDSNGELIVKGDILDGIFRRMQRQLEYAGYTRSIIGIKGAKLVPWL
ncbi:MAG: hypothetical protein IJY62_01335 [Clostridia bacterium]|nr:hypothetical protein [Clostridia bacterium]